MPAVPLRTASLAAAAVFFSPIRPRFVWAWLGVLTAYVVAASAEAAPESHRHPFP